MIKEVTMYTVAKAILLILFPLLAFSQPDTLNLSGYLAGTYTAKHQINVDSAQSQFTWPTALQIGDCDTLDQYIPGIAVLGDSCIRDDEWDENYADVIQDSSDFHSEGFLELAKSFNVAAIDDCGIQSFFVKSVEIVPPGGVDRTSGTREFRILFRAVDWVGHMKEAVMVWIRRDDGCY